MSSNLCPYWFCLLFCFSIGGCQNGGSGSTDPAQNRYYQQYNQIYTNRNSLPPDSTTANLQLYLREFPENAGAWMLAGNLAYGRANYGSAINCYHHAIALQPAQSLYYSALGAAYNVQNQPDSAKKYLFQAISMGDSSAYTYLNIALLYYKLNDRPNSILYADSAISKPGEALFINSGVCFVYYQWKEEEKSQKWFEKAVQVGLKDTFAFRKVLSGEKKLEDYYRENYQHL